MAGSFVDPDSSSHNHSTLDFYREEHFSSFEIDGTPPLSLYLHTRLGATPSSQLPVAIVPAWFFVFNLTSMPTVTLLHLFLN